jgi:hypothetical protein
MPRLDIRRGTSQGLVTWHLQHARDLGHSKPHLLLEGLAELLLGDLVGHLLRGNVCTVGNVGRLGALWVMTVG